MDYPLNNQPATDRYDRMQYKYWQEWLATASHLFRIVA